MSTGTRLSVVPCGYRRLNARAVLFLFCFLNGENALCEKQQLNIGLHTSFSSFALLTLISHLNSRCPSVVMHSFIRHTAWGHSAWMYFSHAREGWDVFGLTVNGRLRQDECNFLSSAVDAMENNKKY